MIKKKVVLIFTFVFVIVLSCGYVFISFKTNHMQNKFYGVQVGAFSSAENADKLKTQLSQLNKATYTYEKEGLIYVLTCISDDQGEIEEEMNWLNQQQIDNAKRTYIYDGNEDISSLDTDALLEFLKQ